MVFTGPPGVGKTVVARTLGDIYRSLDVLRKGHVVEVDRAADWSPAMSARRPPRCSTRASRRSTASCSSTRPIRSRAADRSSGDFGKEAIDTLLKFMEDNRDRIVVIAAGYPNEMRRFIASNPGLQSRFTKTIDFPAYATEELLAIMRVMAGTAGYEMPDDAVAKLQPWIEGNRKSDSWGNARSMRTILEAAREAQAVRINRDPAADLKRIETADIEAAIAAQQ